MYRFNWIEFALKIDKKMHSCPAFLLIRVINEFCAVKIQASSRSGMSGVL